MLGRQRRVQLLVVGKVVVVRVERMVEGEVCGEGVALRVSQWEGGGVDQ